MPLKNQRTKDARKHRPSRLLRRERRRWDDETQNPLCLGCAPCADLPTCGGLHKRHNAMSCLDECCGNPASCNATCPRNQAQFVARLREINGFQLDNIPSTEVLATPNLPVYVPRLYHGSRRARLIEADAVAIPLHALYMRCDGLLKYECREDVAKTFKISPDTKIILIGCGEDGSIEAWWGLMERRREIIAQLKHQSFEFVTAPNYSLFTNQLRYDDMHSMKRIAKTSHEFIAAGIPCALHLNARTTRDYERWADFLRHRPEITHVAFEFGTVWRWPTRQGFHRQHLAWLADSVGRPLHLVMVGGMTAIPTLAAAFDGVTYIDGTPFLKTIKRQRIVEGNDLSLTYLPAHTAPNELLDDLYADNVRSMRARIERMVSEAYAQRAAARSVQKPGNPDRKAFVRDAPPSYRDADPKSSVHDRPTETVDRR